MSQPKYTKIGSTISPATAKETVLSKLINMVHAFRIDASKGFDDNQKKHIDSILKLDDSKTIILETKGEEVTLMHIEDLILEKGKTISLEFSQIRENEEDKVFINYSHIPSIPIGAHIGFVGSTIKLEVIKVTDMHTMCMVTNGGIAHSMQRIEFARYIPKLSFLSEKDKKDVIWGLQSGVNMLAASAIKTAGDIEDIRTFLTENNGQGMKILARLHTPQAYENLRKILQTTDGIILAHTDTSWLPEGVFPIDIVQKAKSQGVAVSISLTREDYLTHEETLDTLIQPYIDAGVDMILLHDDVTELASIPQLPVSNIAQAIFRAEATVTEYGIHTTRVVGNNLDENDYLINIIKTMAIDSHARCIMVYSPTGSTAAKIAAHAMGISILVFTKSDYTFRYNNLLWGIKGYKISQTVEYEEMKKIGKEMIRIHFKGNIALDDKVLILTIQEGVDEDRKTGVNGIELRKFKNI